MIQCVQAVTLSMVSSKIMRWRHREYGVRWIQKAKMIDNARTTVANVRPEKATIREGRKVAGAEAAVGTRWTLV